MDGQVEQIYIDVLVYELDVKVEKQMGNTFHIITYYPNPVLGEVAAKMGVALDDLINQTTRNDYVLQDDS